MSKIIYSLSVCSYGMYLVHYFVVYGIRWVSNSMFPIYTAKPVIMPLVWIIVVFFSWLIIYVLSKIPYLKEVSGAH